jgi:hypothetical protein
VAALRRGSGLTSLTPKTQRGHLAEAPKERQRLTEPRAWPVCFHARARFVPSTSVRFKRRERLYSRRGPASLPGIPECWRGSCRRCFREPCGWSRTLKVLKNRGHFPSDEAATKLIYLALRNITKSWQNPPLTWRMAANQFAIQFGRDLVNEAGAQGMGVTRPHKPAARGNCWALPRLGEIGAERRKINRP